MKKTFRLAAFALLTATAALSLAACGGDDDDDNGGSEPKIIYVDMGGDEYIEMAFVKGGKFMMGAGNDDDAYVDEKPQHEVELSDFYIGTREVAQHEWEHIMESNPSQDKDQTFPVTNVSWDDCQTFVEKLSKKTGKKFRLPTEAEWEYAARGGQLSQGKPYATGSNNDATFWHEGNSGGKLHGVYSNPNHNELGIYDMSGNVWEWCQDVYEIGYYEESPKKNPKGPAEGQLRVMRGGSYDLPAKYGLVYRRGNFNHAYSHSVWGLRVVMEK